MRELVIRGLAKCFGAGRAVDGIDLTVAKGEFVVLLGPSGCGKTTTLRMVAGLERPDAGRIAIGGQVVAAPAEDVWVPPQQRNLGMVFQSYAIWPHMTVAENVGFPLRYRRIPPREAGQRVAQALELVGLGDFARRSATQLSGGQMQRVAIARALVYRPSLLLFDEPLSNLDAKLRAHLRFELKEIQRRTGVTALYVTHDQAEAVVLGDRIVVMNQGRIVQTATPEELYNHPANLFVANFTGAANLVPGQVRAVNGRPRLVVGDGLEMPKPAHAMVQPGQDVTVWVRPENLALAGSPTPDAGGDRPCWPAQVQQAEFLGTQTQYRVLAGGVHWRVIRLGSQMEFRPGDAVWLQVSPDHVSVFPGRPEEVSA